MPIGPQARKWGDSSKSICVNPLTWRTDGAAADASLNIGGVSYAGTFEGTLADVKGVPQDFVDAKPLLEPGVADAQCVDGMLLVRRFTRSTTPRARWVRQLPHLYDYNLFHMNLRKNVEGRVAKFLSQDRFALIQADGQPTNSAAKQQRRARRDQRVQRRNGVAAHQTRREQMLTEARDRHQRRAGLGAVTTANMIGAIGNSITTDNHD